MIQDVIDLRKNQWELRRKDNNTEIFVVRSKVTSFYFHILQENINLSILYLKTYRLMIQMLESVAVLTDGVLPLGVAVLPLVACLSQ